VVVVGDGQRRLKVGLSQKILLGNGRNRRSHGIQQQVELNVTHGALLSSQERMVSKRLCFRIDRIVPILTNERPQPGLINKGLIFSRDGWNRLSRTQREKNHIRRKIFRVIPNDTCAGRHRLDP
jgi:hypothetical protein